MLRAKPCIVCGRRVEGGSPRCVMHKEGSGRARPCLVCGRPAQGNYCDFHRPEVDEELRNLANPYRRAYKDPQYAKNKQHRFERARGRCESCGIHLEAGDWQCDHLIPLSKGGTNDITNLRILCKPCHLAKTAADRRRTTER